MNILRRLNEGLNEMQFNLLKDKATRPRRPGKMVLGLGQDPRRLEYQQDPEGYRQRWLAERTGPDPVAVRKYQAALAARPRPPLPPYAGPRTKPRPPDPPVGRGRGR